LENNLKMFFNIASHPELYGNLIYFGSGAEFSRKYWDVKMSEDYFGKHIPDDQYGFSKYIMNLYSRSSDRVYNLRLFGTFGGKDDWRYRFIPNLCAQSVLGLDLIVKQNAVFNFLYINDLLKILERFIETPPESGDYNICDDNKNDIELIELAKIIKKQSSKNKNIIIKEEGLSTKYSGDNSKLKKVFSDITFTSIEESIGNVHSSLLKNLDKLKTSELLIS
jgi:GDP-L-fucose synthase